MIIRRKTREIKVGDVKIGGSAPVSIQSMTKTDTRKVCETVNQIKRLKEVGCNIIRVAVLDIEGAKAIREIKKKINIPLVADIHFHYKLAIEAINSGADKIRLNPGNIRKKEEIEQVVKLAKKKGIPIRIGLNSGSLPDSSSNGQIKTMSYPRKRVSIHKSMLDSRLRGNDRGMARCALDYIKLFEDLDFRDIIISLKASDVLATIEAYREMAKLCDYPFHLGVTATGPSRCGIIKSSVGIGTLLAEGIGDTIRVSLTGSPEDEVVTGKEILSSLGLRKGGIDIISCPTCGRCEVDLVKVVKELENKLSVVPARHLFNQKAGGSCQLSDKPLKVAVMGCVVNGPGEAKDADIGIAAGKRCGILFKKGKAVRKISEKDFVKVLLEELKLLRMQTDENHG